MQTDQLSRPLQSTHSAADAYQNLKRFDTTIFNNQTRAIDFVLQYIPTFCVYCPVTGQLYTDYDLYNVNRATGVVVLPRHEHDTFNDIVVNAVTPSSLVLVTNDRLAKARIINQRERSMSHPASSHLLSLSTNTNFLPVILKSDLRRLKSDLPCLRLHSIHIDRLPMISALDRTQIHSTVMDKLVQSVSTWGW